MTKKKFWVGVVFCLFTIAGLDARADHGAIKEVFVRIAPSLYLNAEFGLGYSDTGTIPAELELRCGDPAQADGPLVTCGQVDINIRTRSYGLQAFLLNYTRKNPLLIQLHVNPNDANLADILGSYVGARAGGGLVFGARGMALVNFLSGVFATTQQNLLPNSGPDRAGWGVDLGVDLSVPVLEISYEGSEDPNRLLSTFVI